MTTEKRIDGKIARIKDDCFFIKDENDSKEYKVKTDKSTIFIEVFLEKDIEKTMEICYHIGTISESERGRVKKYDSTTPPLQRSFQNCLAFGGFSHRRSYSYHGKDLVYYNLNEDNIGFSYHKVDFEKEKV